MSTATNETTHVASEHQLQNQLSQTKLLGEAVFTNLRENRGQTNTHAEVLTALRAAGLDEKVAKEIKPTQAFNRATNRKTLKKGRVIDEVRNDTDDILFQFSHKTKEDDPEDGKAQFKYPKEAKLLLEKRTGTIISNNSELRELAQKELDRCLAERTTSDISAIVQKLLQANADLIPLAVGAWFVPLDQVAFVDKVEAFLKALGRNLKRLPIPEGTQQGDRAIAESVCDYFEDMLAKLRESVKEFTLSTRQDTISKAGEKYASIRAKLESFMTIAGDQLNTAKEEVEQGEEELRQQIEKLAKDRSVAPPATRTSGGLFGHSISSVMHRLSAANWPFEKAKKAIMALADTSGIKESSLRTFWSDGRNPKYAKPAELTVEQLTELETAASKDTGTEANIEAGAETDKPEEAVAPATELASAAN